LIRFKLIQSDDLGNLQTVVPTSVDYDRTGDVHEMRITVPEADQGFFKLVLSLDEAS
jgi:predicted alpha/beta-fold hydrolase